MPNRILRDWTDSKRMDSLTWQAEVVFVRLIQKMDDAGNFHRDAPIVKSLLFPRRDGLRASDIDRWLKELEAADIIRCYPAKGDTFLHIVNHGQRKDRTHVIFPREPDGFDDRINDNHPPQSAAERSEPPPETKRIEYESETKRITRAKEFSSLKIPDFEEFKNFALEKKPKIDVQHLELKYQAWVEAGWKDGFGKKILNWKSKLLNTIPHIRELPDDQKSNFQKKQESFDEAQALALAMYEENQRKKELDPVNFG